MARTPTITRAEYDALARHEYAGTATDLLTQTVDAFKSHHADWSGRHWFMHAGSAGTTLSPVNVVG